MFGINDIRNSFATIQNVANEIEVKGNSNITNILLIINVCEKCIKGIDEAVKEMSEKKSEDLESSSLQEGD